MNSTDVEHSGYLEYLKGNPNLPSSMFARRETFEPLRHGLWFFQEPDQQPAARLV